MYSHWLTSPPPPLPSAASNHTAYYPENQHHHHLPPPDTILDIGPPPYYRYLAHSQVISQHSGYLRSGISSAINAVTTNSSSSSAPPPLHHQYEKQIYVPNVNVDQFTPLLRYMYTGYLNITADNIFGVLLATHILHMPQALEICRAHLSRMQSQGLFTPIAEKAALTAADPDSLLLLPPPLTKTQVLRPIPSKPTSVERAALSAHILCSSPQSPHILLPSHDSTFQTPGSISALTANKAPVSSCHAKTQQHDRVEGYAQIMSLRTGKDIVVASNKNSDANKRSIPPPPPAPFESCTRATNPTPPGTAALHPPPALSSSTSSGALAVSSKVIIDVASCDGPVRFRRVLNKSYTINRQQQQQIGPNPKSVKYPNNHQHHHHQERVDLASSPSKTTFISTSTSSGGNRFIDISFHKQMVRDINEQQQQQLYHQQKPVQRQCPRRRYNIGRSRRRSEDANPKDESNNSSTGTNHHPFVCVYCKHTFKSEYCYMKHAQRHLNPEHPNLSPQCSAASSSPSSDDDNNNSITNKSAVERENNTPPPNASLKTGSFGESKRYEVDTAASSSRRCPLDMNVQYYPCKTCGSKFPSYYFVHKHRKMCHLNEADDDAEDDNDSKGGNHGDDSLLVSNSIIFDDAAADYTTGKEEVVTAPKTIFHPNTSPNDTPPTTTTTNTIKSNYNYEHGTAAQENRSL